MAQILQKTESYRFKLNKLQTEGKGQKNSTPSHIIVKLLKTRQNKHFESNHRETML